MKAGWWDAPLMLWDLAEAISSICFTPVFHSFTIPLSQCAPAGSAEQSTSTLLVAWSAHNSLIAWAASLHQRFYSVVSYTIAFPPVFYVWVCTCFSLHLSSHVHSHIFMCLQFLRPSVPPHGSAEQSTNTLLVAWLVHNLLIAWLASPHRCFYFIFHTLLHFCQFFNILVCTCLSLYFSSHVYSYVFINLQYFHLSVLPRGTAEQSTNTVLVAWPAHIPWLHHLPHLTKLSRAINLTQQLIPFCPAPYLHLKHQEHPLD